MVNICIHYIFKLVKYPGYMILWIIIGIVLIALVFMYNGLVRLRNQVKNGWAQIDVQLKRRVDLIPNLVETVKGYAKHEKKVLDDVTKARASLMNAQGAEANAKADNMLAGTLKSLFAVAENYPDLKANQNFLQLQEELSGTENKIAYARQFYNDVVMKYNTQIQSVPYNILAGMFGFKEEKMFETQDREPVKVSF